MSRAYECVIRRRHRLGTEIAACGTMAWDSALKAYRFSWSIPPDFHPTCLLVVEVDVFEDKENPPGVLVRYWSV